MPERVRPCHRCGSKANTRTKGTGLAPLVEYGWGHEFVLMQMFVLPVRHCRFQNRGVLDRGKTSVTFSSALLWRMLYFLDEGSLEVLVADLTTFGRFYGPMGSLTNRCADYEFLATYFLHKNLPQLLALVQPFSELFYAGPCAKIVCVLVISFNNAPDMLGVGEFQVLVNICCRKTRCIDGKGPCTEAFLVSCKKRLCCIRDRLKSLSGVV